MIHKHSWVGLHTMLGTIDIVLVTKHTDGHAWTGNLGQLDGTRETLITLGVIVLEADLEFDGCSMVSMRLSKEIAQEPLLEERFRNRIWRRTLEEVPLLGFLTVL
jgi:hypothetical protein